MPVSSFAFEARIILLPKSRIQWKITSCPAIVLFSWNADPAITSWIWFCRPLSSHSSVCWRSFSHLEAEKRLVTSWPFANLILLVLLPFHVTLTHKATFCLSGEPHRRCVLFVSCDPNPVSDLCVSGEPRPHSAAGNHSHSTARFRPTSATESGEADSE